MKTVASTFETNHVRSSGVDLFFGSCLLWGRANPQFGAGTPEQALGTKSRKRNVFRQNVGKFEPRSTKMS